MKDLKQFIKITIREFLNEQQTNTNNVKYWMNFVFDEIEFIEPTKSNALKLTKSGVPRFTELVKFIFEGKNVALTNYHIGKMIFYLQLMNNYQPISYGLLFNASDFYYIESSEGRVLSIEKGLFSSIGSYDYVISKISGTKIPEIELYDNAMRSFCGTLNLSEVAPFSYLGAGKYGKVFSCTVDNHPRSIKLIKLGFDENSMNLEDIQAELDKFRIVYELDKTLTFLPYSNVLLYESTDSSSIAAYLLGGVGKKIKLSMKSANSIIWRLYELHKLGVIHGDPRHPNILKTNTILRWIDFRYDLPFTEENIFKDMRILLRNVIYWKQTNDEDIMQYAQAMIGDDDTSAMTVLYKLTGEDYMIDDDDTSTMTSGDSSPSLAMTALYRLTG
jgi:hypothetical protein